MFGANKGFSFGTTPVPNNNLFGSNAVTSSSGFSGFGTKPGGLFGQPATTTATTGFGAGGGLFGSTAPTGGLFGTPTTTPQQATGSLFGQTNATGSFLKPTNGNAFGATTGAFGASTGSGMFGSTQPTTGASGGLFGATQTSTAAGASAFGPSFGTNFAATAAVIATGTTGAKFAATDGTDNMVRSGISTTVKTKHYCITGMKQYETKSLEELRFDDYAAGVKGPKAAAAATGGLFGSAPTSTAGFAGFGTTPASSTTFGGFGTTTTQANAFGAKPAGGLFGSTQTTGGLFGQPSASTSAFGTTTSTAQPGGLFGSTAAKPAGLFGASTGFGTGTAPFGQASTASTGFAFGAKPAATGFGTTAGTTGFAGFGTQNAPSTGFGAFGAKQPTAFGAQPATGTTAFGFGTAGQAGAATGFGLNKPTIGFGTGTSFGTGASGFAGLATAAPQNAEQVQLTSNLDMQVQQALIQQQIYALANSPYGDSPLFKNVSKDSKAKKDLVPTDPAAQQTVLANSRSKQKVSSRPSAVVKLTNLPSVQAIGTASNNKTDLFDGLDDDAFTPEKFGTRRSVKKLVIRSSPAVGSGSSRITTADQQQSAFSSPSLYSAQTRLAVGQSPLVDDTFNLSAVPKPERRPVNKLYPTLELDDTIDEFQSGAVPHRPAKPSPVDRKPTVDATYNVSPVSSATFAGSAPPSPSDDLQEVQSRLRVSKQEHVDVTEREGLDEGDTALPHPCGVVCTRTDYYTLPSLDELGEYLDSNGDCFIENLSIGREGYGSVFFPGTTNLANLDIDSTVHFRRKEITVYPDDDRKPPEGQGLNKRAEVTLDCVWPSDKSTKSPIKSPSRLKAMSYQEKVETATARIGAKFIDYRPDTGSWVFEVKHFSKYGLLDDDSDSDNEAASGQAAPRDLKKLKALHLQSTNVQRQSVHQADPSQKHKLASGDALGSRGLGVSPAARPEVTNYLGMEDSDEEQENHKPQGSVHSSLAMADLQDELTGTRNLVAHLLPTSHQLAAQCGVGTTNVQRMKASFLGDDEDDMVMGRDSISFRAEGSPSIPLLKQQYHGVPSFSPLPESPLMRSAFKADSPTLNKYGSSFYKTEAQSDYKSEWEVDNKRALLKTHRASSEIKLPEPDYPLLPSGAERPLKPRSKIQGHRLQLTQLPLEKSLLCGRQRNSLIDAQCTAGRRSRVSWAPELRLAHNGNSSIFSPADDRRSSRRRTNFSILSPGRTRLTTPYQVKLETANVGTRSYQMDPLVLETRVKALKIQLQNCKVSRTEGASCHRLEPEVGIAALHEYGRVSLNDLDAAVAAQNGSTVETMLRQHILTWELVVALWGSLPEFEHIDDLDRDSYLYQSARNEAFSRWLSYAANYKVEQETSLKSKQVKGIPAAIFSYLTARQIPEATKLAIESKDLRLALLVSQAGSSQTTKNMMHKQLTDWNNTMADKFIQHDRLRLYTVLAGSMVWETSSRLVNCCLDLDWKRALALHYWYCQSKLNIRTAVARYDAAWKEESDCEVYAAPPLPLYMEESGDDDSHSRDTCYHLLKLYCNSSYRLDHLLAAASSTSDPLDYHMSWHLLQVLTALGYTHLGDWQTAVLHTRYSEQLESCGLWEWAVFPLLNLSCQHSREKCIKELLLRHVRLNVTDAGSGDNDSLSSDDMESGDGDYLRKERFLLTELMVPSRWLHEAKAIKARCEGLHAEETWHMLQSGQLNSAHQLVLDKMAPQLVVAGDLDGLHGYLDILQQGSDSISGWIIGGKIYLDYITTHDVVEELRLQQDSADAYSLEKLRPEVHSLGRRLLSLSTPTPFHLLAQSMMALQTAFNIKYVMAIERDRLVPDTDSVSARHLVEPLSSLPLQTDDSLSLLRETMSAFMLEY